jgi:DNA-binding response OmpR family regulator
VEINVETILCAILVEDYKPCQKIMTHYLHGLGYQVDLAVDGVTAIQNINNKAYDLVVQDIGLRGIGKEIIRVARHSHLNQGTPLIVWSAYVNRNDEEKYLDWGADSVLIKACQIPDLEKAIQQCFLTPRYEREFNYKLKILQKKWEQNCPSEWVKKINDLRHLPFSILNEALHIIREYQQWSDFHANERNARS